MSLSVIPDLQPGQYQAHALHSGSTDWPETNCYIDVWIEVLHALKCQPLACLSMVFANDFDGDQWTFYKPPHEDLYQLYGIDVQELNVWRGLLENASEQLRRGRLVLSEIDSYFLPDTQATDYRKNHVKTTIAIQEIDLAWHRMRYFHNGGFHELQGEDFDQIFRLHQAPDPQHMPFFAEFVRLDRLRRSSENELAASAWPLLRKHLARRPASNPLLAYAPVFQAEVQQLQQQGMAAYHAYAFANLRQLGAGFYLGAQFLNWLATHSAAPAAQLTAAADSAAAISAISKTLLLKTARAVMSGKAVDFSANLQEMAQHWDNCMSTLDQCV